LHFIDAPIVNLIMVVAYSDYRKILGRQVRRLRRDALLSQEALAQRCSVYRPYLSRIESGIANPTLLVLVSLSQALDVHIRELFEYPQNGH